MSQFRKLVVGLSASRILAPYKYKEIPKPKDNQRFRLLQPILTSTTIESNHLEIISRWHADQRDVTAIARTRFVRLLSQLREADSRDPNAHKAIRLSHITNTILRGGSRRGDHVSCSSRYRDIFSDGQ